jgi:hypothetical protein
VAQVSWHHCCRGVFKQCDIKPALWLAVLEAVWSFDCGMDAALDLGSIQSYTDLCICITTCLTRYITLAPGQAQVPGFCPCCSPIWHHKAIRVCIVWESDDNIDVVSNCSPGCCSVCVYAPMMLPCLASV